jgi:hypothetical protein
MRTIPVEDEVGQIGRSHGPLPPEVTLRLGMWWAEEPSPHGGRDPDAIEAATGHQFGSHEHVQKRQEFVRLYRRHCESPEG